MHYSHTPPVPARDRPAFPWAFTALAVWVLGWSLVGYLAGWASLALAGVVLLALVGGLLLLARDEEAIIATYLQGEAAGVDSE